MKFEALPRQKIYLFSTIILFFLILTGFFLFWPIVMYDADLWYHLSGGRHLLQTRTIPHEAFFSYIEPAKSWYNYYWLFQAIIYKIFQGTGYYGLIVLRAAIYGLTSFFILLFFTHRNEDKTQLLSGFIIFVSLTLSIMQRELLVRPHLFSYLFIVVFLYILEKRRDKIWLLPILGIFWANLHGIEYPVMFLIAAAYLLDIWGRRFRKDAPQGQKNETWLLIAVFYTIFLSPGVVKLVQTPFSVSFQNAPLQHLYVAELLPPVWRNFFIFAPVTAAGIIACLRNIIVILTVFSFLLCLVKKELRLSHLALFVGAIMLLAKHNRFHYEFMLLSIPILQSGLRLIARMVSLPKRAADFAIPLVMTVFPFFVLSNTLADRPAYPFSRTNLPVGIVRFLNSHLPGDRILNDPNTGGYLSWALNKKFKIYMDMQLTIFSDTDLATAQNAFDDVTAFESFIGKYKPGFILASLAKGNFKKIVASDSRYVPIFIDHAEALYINKEKYGEIAGKYELKEIDPYGFGEIKYENQNPGIMSRLFLEAARMYQQDPGNYPAATILCGIAVAHGQYNQALSYAEAIIRNYPEFSAGYALKGDALFGMKKYDEAAVLYEKALQMGQTGKAENVYWNLHATYIKLKEYKKAYRLLSKYVNPFSPGSNYKDIYQLALSAASAGKVREAVTFLEIAKMKTPPADTEYVQKISAQLANLNGVAN
ncbi:MAG: CDC27 family protein [Thermoleophilia bacterium]